MRFLADENIAPRVIEELHRNGFDVVNVLLPTTKILEVLFSSHSNYMPE